MTSLLRWPVLTRPRVAGFARPVTVATADVLAVFEHGDETLGNIVSSDLDADRIDYLLRTALHAGLPYGHVDIDYLVGQMRLDDRRRVCITARATRTAEHVLQGRILDYRTVAFHKTVVAFELLLQNLIAEALRRDLIQDCDRAGVENMISEGRWSHFDDDQVMHAIHDLSDAADGSEWDIKARSLLDRQPPRLVVGNEVLESVCLASERAHANRIKLTKALVEDLVGRTSIPAGYWYVWEKALRYTKIGSAVEVLEKIEEGGGVGEEVFDQAVRVLDATTGESHPITMLPDSPLRVLSEQCYFAIRVYVVVPPDAAMTADQVRLMANGLDLPW